MNGPLNFSQQSTGIPFQQKFLSIYYNFNQSQNIRAAENAELFWDWLIKLYMVVKFHRGHLLRKSKMLSALKFSLLVISN